MIAVSLDVHLIISGKTVHMHAKLYKHNEDGRTAPGMRNHGTIPLGHSGNVVIRIGLQNDYS